MCAIPLSGRCQSKRTINCEIIEFYGLSVIPGIVWILRPSIVNGNIASNNNFGGYQAGSVPLAIIEIGVICRKISELDCGLRSAPIGHVKTGPVEVQIRRRLGIGVDHRCQSLGHCILSLAAESGANSCRLPRIGLANDPASTGYEVCYKGLG